MMLSQRSFLPATLLVIVSFPFASLLVGCTLATTAADEPIAGVAFQGFSHGGGQPVVGQHVYLMAAAVSGVGAAGYGVASTSLLTGTGQSDSLGSYVLTGSNGNWSFSSGSGSTATYMYTCPSSATQVYVYGVGGNPGAGTNSSESMMAALGSCGNLSSSTAIWMSELTTVAAAYSLSGFATDALHVSIPKYVNATQQTNNITDALAQTGLQNAFTNALNLVNTSTGVAQTTTPGGNGTPATAQIITLGNILAACVNASNTFPTNCTTLFNNSLKSGATGTAPTDTATAAINIAHHPYVSATVMSNLYGLQAASGAPFAGGQVSTPNDFTVKIYFTGGGLNQSTQLAVDGLGDIWVSSPGNDTLNKFSPLGVALSTSSGFTGGGLTNPFGVAIDVSGNAWVANLNGNNVSKFNSSGVTQAGTTGFKGNNDLHPYQIAIDTNGFVWVTNYGTTVSKLSSAGAETLNSADSGEFQQTTGIAIDASNNVWVADAVDGEIDVLSNADGLDANQGGASGGEIVCPKVTCRFLALDNHTFAWASNANGFLTNGTNPSVYSSASSYTGGGLTNSLSNIIDGAGNIWVTNNTNLIAEFNNAGTAITPGTGFTTTLGKTYGVAVDGSGNVWVTDNGTSSTKLLEFVGAATPTVTPLVASIMAPYSTPAAKP